MDESPTPPPLSSSSEAVLETLTPWLTTADQGLPRAEVTRRLQAAGFEPATIDAALEQLLDRGYLYAVHDDLRLTAESL